MGFDPVSLDALMALRPRLGVRNSAHIMAKLLDPAPGRSLRVVAVTHPEYLDSMSDDVIVGLNIPTAQPLVYELDADLKPISHYYLADPEEIARAHELVESGEVIGNVVIQVSHD